MVKIKLSDSSLRPFITIPNMPIFKKNEWHDISEVTPEVRYYILTNDFDVDDISVKKAIQAKLKTLMSEQVEYKEKVKKEIEDKNEENINEVEE